MQEIGLEVKINGKVQGVYFRYYTKQKADELGLKGYVSNLDDGSVYAVVTGNETQVGEFIDWCAKGSPKSQVNKVESKKLEQLPEFSEFEIRHDKDDPPY